VYGDTAQIRQRANLLRAEATAARGRAGSILTGLSTMGWNSRAATVFTTQAEAIVEDLQRIATELDGAAQRLDEHARAVDEVKEAIRQAQEWVEDRLADARNIVGAAIDGAVGMVRVSVYTLWGHEVSESQVRRAQAITSAVPSTPVRGSKEWLDLRNRFTSNGWG
jgi:hypothetical protein